MRKTAIIIVFAVLIVLCLQVSVTADSGEFDFQGYFKSKVKAYQAEAIKVRRHLHQYPELCLKENKTSAFVADYLKKCGLEVETGLGGTGLKAILRGNRDKPVVAVRADMDALPILENCETTASFRSRNEGVMHACGHDVHMTNVLMTAKLLSEIKDKLPGTVVFLFQPCEEGAPGGGATGAARMIKAGALQNPQVNAILGLHVMPQFPLGSIALREGPLMANVATIYVTINGKSSHGAFPHQGIDAIYAASTAVVQFQSLISRFKDPKEQAVLSIGKIKGGVRSNVIAEKVEMEGTVRTFSFDTEAKIEKGMENILNGLSVSQGITYGFKFDRVSKYVKNDPPLTALLTPLFQRLLGEKNVITADPLTIGEDFAYYSHEIPACFFFLGTGAKSKLHTPQFTVDEDIFLYGPLLFASGAVELLQQLPCK